MGHSRPLLPVADDCALIFFLFMIAALRPMGGGFGSGFIKSSARRMDKAMNNTTFRRRRRHGHRQAGT